MNKAITTALKLARKSYKRLTNDMSGLRKTDLVSMRDYANRLIYRELLADKPCMIARLGANELTCMVNHIGVHNPPIKNKVLSYITRRSPLWWWDDNTAKQMVQCAGFYPPTIPNMERFSELMMEILPNVDILGSWLSDESYFEDKLSGAKKILLEDLEPFFTETPWTKALEAKKVLVVHPFAGSIQEQYKIREKIFPDGLLPKFELSTITAVQSICGQSTCFKDWFEALDHMKEQIERSDFDICILGCGAYGFPLASFIKESGRKAIHLGGVTQLLFGIKGKRWEAYESFPYNNLFNEHWMRPSQKETPTQATLVEGGCYW